MNACLLLFDHPHSLAPAATKNYQGLTEKMAAVSEKSPTA
jgi:hypothetical protein